MSVHRLSIDVDEEQHKYIKMCCAKLGMTIKSFAIQSLLEKVEEYEDRCLFKEDEKDTGENFVLIDHSGKLHALPS